MTIVSNMTNTNTNNRPIPTINDAEWTRFVTELQQCRDGSRGWVSCTQARAATIGVPQRHLTVAASALGLTVGAHGRYGTVASRSARL